MSSIYLCSRLSRPPIPRCCRRLFPGWKPAGVVRSQRVAVRVANAVNMVRSAVELDDAEAVSLGAGVRTLTRSGRRHRRSSHRRPACDDAIRVLVIDGTQNVRGQAVWHLRKDCLTVAQYLRFAPAVGVAGRVPQQGSLFGGPVRLGTEPAGLLWAETASAAALSVVRGPGGVVVPGRRRRSRRACPRAVNLERHRSGRRRCHALDVVNDLLERAAACLSTAWYSLPYPPNSAAAAADTSSCAAATRPGVGPAAAALAAPIAELISATSVVAAAIKCGCVSKLGFGYSSTTACLHRATAEPAPVS